MKHVGTTRFIVSSDDYVALCRDAYGVGTLGAYKGAEEYGLMITGESKRAKVMEVAARHKQESVLEISPDGFCYLLFIGGGGEQLIGRWTPVDEQTARSRDGWTRVRSQYFIAE